jgi:cyclopropane fatty-acyl-phospholipid synthase-like methyltransferase
LAGDIRQPYVHALGLRTLNRLYDPLFRLTMPERAFRRQLLEQAQLAPGMGILDVGCGTGALLIEAFRFERNAVLSAYTWDRWTNTADAAEQVGHFPLVGLEWRF